MKSKLLLCLFLLTSLLWQPTFAQARKAKERQASKTAPATTAVANSLLWEISGNGLKQPSYLYGTFHLLNDSYLSTTPEVKQHFEQSKAVVIEADIDSSKVMQLAGYMVMPENKLSELLSAEEYQLVATETKNVLGYDLAMLDHMKPVSLMLLLSVTEYKDLEAVKKFEDGQALDMYFASQGRSNNKKMFYLETLEQQMQLLYDHHSLDQQAQQLIAFVKSKDYVLNSQEELTNLYFNKDLQAMVAASEAYSKKMGEEDMAYMLDDRNKNWMTQLPQILKAQQTFIAVGAMHLPGNNGLIKLLQNAGYTVKPLQ
ncbi:TraB/GumN family protein [Pontibacter qinzhouensis]|uniref:TraB/GumN family protein n=1 Tax=Pontibacter qinzhouensis TaxID=2603253 RepID=A0A5C8JGH2_9BACT|nr:TraB/GumN family protein [Pontibacter qinzhouensis]TXK37410.1 TraB/GumN family protein [Pontibacter qinzhouensis]